MVRHSSSLIINSILDLERTKQYDTNFNQERITMAITIAVTREWNEEEKRVAITPTLAPRLIQRDIEIRLQAGAGEGAGFSDSAYSNVSLCKNLTECYRDAAIIFRVTPPSIADIKKMPRDALVIGLLAPHADEKRIKAFEEQNITAFALELLPRITRAQAMDVLSSQASIVGYKAVLVAANTVGNYFPMLTTAASTIRPIKVLVIGAGVAGLQAIATAKRLGAIVSAYDVRPEAKEQVESLGAQMVKLSISGSGSGGYARELTPEERQQQQIELTKHIASAQVIITTAAVPGKKAPLIISKDAVAQMQSGSVIVDVAAPMGGNCELTEAGKSVDYQGVKIIGPTHLPSGLARDASQLFGSNLIHFLELLLNEKNEIAIDWQDEILNKTAIAKGATRYSTKTNPDAIPAQTHRRQLKGAR
ncbi:NAD(P) transhydrogenase subunit alpha [Coxiella burnetii]|uniref:NAD(P) transhydrogenase subunit alpha n=1 Tax=Coxiella burnetii TaxID=777 RepID=UPI000183D05E|nr:NAD(P) transhydrogenase subunit alpha [Coxiella burnetii]ACJ19390.1 NAD(P) transhydrogenase alpha subunit [Coxiella burnetii CbuK_Q154]EAX33922.2 NAD(P) transhydrogenase subunit alpha [Coxiella burnetii 'MSU Goat Q177']UYK69629.1 NAD(P) transhydrogenase subunit alpha [Coxiella burnetii]